MEGLCIVENLWQFGRDSKDASPQSDWVTFSDRATVVKVVVNESQLRDFMFCASLAWL